MGERKEMVVTAGRQAVLLRQAGVPSRGVWGLGGSEKAETCEFLRQSSQGDGGGNLKCLPDPRNPPDT